MKKIVGLTLDLSTKPVFSLDKYQLKNMGWNSVFAIQHIENRKRITEVLPPPRDQIIPFAYSCSFTFYTLYRNGGGGGGTLSKCSKTLYYKSLLETYFVKTCR